MPYQKDFVAVAVEYPRVKDKAAVAAHITRFAQQSRYSCSSISMHEQTGGGFCVKINFTDPKQAAAAVKEQLPSVNGSAPQIMPWSARRKCLRPGGKCLPTLWTGSA